MNDNAGVLHKLYCWNYALDLMWHVTQKHSAEYLTGMSSAKITWADTKRKVSMNLQTKQTNINVTSYTNLNHTESVPENHFTKVAY